MIAAYGRRAQRIESALPPDISDAVIFDETGIAAALADANARRSRGECFAVLALIDDAAIKRHRLFATELDAVISDRERRYYTVHMYGRGQSLGGEPLPELWSVEYAAFLAAAQEVFALSDVLLVRSNFEYAELCKRSAFYQNKKFRRILLRDTVPEVRRKHADAPSVLLWTGRREMADATLSLIGLEEFHGDVTYVGESPIPNIEARFISRDDPALSEALAVASCVVCVDAADPCDAVAFARRGIPVVAPLSCAAYEFVDGIVCWDMADASNLSVRVNFALGTVPAAIDAETVALRPPATAVPAGYELPLVSILTATHNRPESLHKMLTCLAAQTYSNIESIIVNDAGESVEHVVAQFPFARLINAGANRGTFFRASQLGLAEARGEYVAMLPDDDWFYPDHIELLVSALLRTGARVAHSFGLVRFSRTVADGSEETFGFNTLPYSASVNPTSALVGTPVAMSQCLMHRDLFDPADVGWPRLEAAAEAGADQEYFMRIMQRHQLVAVDRYTCEFRDHAGNAGKAYNWADAMEYVYRELQPLTGRPITDSLREQSIATLRSVPVGENTNKPTIRFA